MLRTQEAPKGYAVFETKPRKKLPQVSNTFLIFCTLLFKSIGGRCRNNWFVANSWIIDVTGGDFATTLPFAISRGVRHHAARPEHASKCVVRRSSCPAAVASSNMLGFVPQSRALCSDCEAKCGRKSVAPF